MLSVMAAPTPKMGCLGKLDDSLMVIVADSKQFAGEHVNVRMSRQLTRARVRCVIFDIL